MAFTKFSKVIYVKYAGVAASHPYVSRKRKPELTFVKDDDPFDPLYLAVKVEYKQCNTKWKMSKDKKQIYAICAHGIKFILDERDSNGSKRI